MSKEKGFLEKIGSVKNKEAEKPKEANDLEWPEESIEVADRNIDGYLERYSLVVIDCWSRSCRPCRTVSPIIDRIAKANQGKILFGKLNIQRNKVTPRKYNVKSIPTILVFKDGKLVDRHTGIASRKKIESFINRISES